ncbi:hypothetical protein H0X09_01230 [Candidatus Saccharibacteria bacterium]|nr:hypothetical protein [Candidatus Saccharibacteria bacterium]
MIRRNAEAIKTFLLGSSGLIAAGLLFMGGIPNPVVYADTIVRAFNSKDSLQPGWVVAVDKDQANTVEAAPANDPSRIYGVVIDPSRAPVTLQPEQGLKVYVATSGSYQVLVTTQNGSINPGDYISISSTNGIAAKATSEQSYVLGQALEKFDGDNNVISAGEEGDAIGRVTVSIVPGKNPLVKSAVAVPAPLRRAGEAIAGKNVTPLRIYAALAVFTVTALIAVSILWIGVRSGMISIGRNPLSRHSIIQGLMQVVIVAVLVFAVGIFGVYLLLRL